ncbi:toll/interleukin-1 receptor domain-containing protein [Sphingomonas sp.]|uniref:toll/interleukin-1 receptor domain-containing protein n=1 Tax=Sphingomonas sp. TaxID=28214 RepID=UPI0025CE47E4|nr:toll/interleukin-1 receptor domain-containing protein [Sphingomonas sp.]MBV9529107.1 toll/interleukin-1 receptor domain-containing protein [Sphingomonas sp.]
MGKHARFDAEDGAPVATGANAAAAPGFKRRYYAFISYSHKDSDFADWLHRQLECFHVPKTIAGRLTATGTVPQRLNPVFRDRHELAAGDDLGTEIQAALASSQFLIVLCSPAAAKSHWTNAEVETFKRSRPDGCVFAAIVAGEPFASEIPGREAEECFPPALRHRFDSLGRPTGRRAEPLAADFRETGDGRRLALLKLIAGMIGVGLDELVRREATRRHRQLAWLAAASLGGMAVTSTLAIVAVQARDSAREQRREAEGLISFMLGDLKDKLEPIGRLDALDGVGGRVLAYYHKQDTAELSDSSLMQRSSALSLMANVANSRGDLDGASRLYREAMAGTSEAIRRKPDDPQRIFNHAQNVFYLADIAMRRGDEKAAEAALHQYETLSNREVALDPSDMRWRMESQNAEANLGVMLYNQRRYAEASVKLEQAVRAIDAFAIADPGNIDNQKSLVESLAWVADSHSAEGRLDQAITDRERDVDVAKRLLAKTRDSEFGSKLIVAERILAKLYADRAQFDRAIALDRDAEDQSERLLAVEPGNTKWTERAAQAHLEMALYFLAKGATERAAGEAAAGCDLSNSLSRKDATISDWRALRRDCLRMQGTIALAAGNEAKALVLAGQAVNAAKAVDGTDPVEDRYVVAKAYRLLGDVQRSAGNADAARAAWAAGLAMIPKALTERPPEMSIHESLLKRLGQTAAAAQLSARLAAIGYREPEFRSE